MYYRVVHKRRPRLNLKEQLDRFLRQVDMTFSPKGCWLWIGTFNADGYGRIKITFVDGSFERLAHRVAYIWWVGPIPKGKKVLHKRFCNYRGCINPQHLYAGTDQDNADDRDATGNQVRGKAHHMHLYPDYAARGSASGKSKLTERQILVIRALYRRSWLQRTIAKKFGISQMSVSNIICRKNWKHVR